MAEEIKEVVETANTEVKETKVPNCISSCPASFLAFKSSLYD